MKFRTRRIMDPKSEGFGGTGSAVCLIPSNRTGLQLRTQAMLVYVSSSFGEPRYRYRIEIAPFGSVPKHCESLTFL